MPDEAGEHHDPPVAPSRIATAALTAAALAALPALALAKTPAVYTAAQAHHGQRVYSDHCATCHGARLSGQVGPALEGRRFDRMASTQHLTARRLSRFIRDHMPKTNPGSLSARQYDEVTAYILSENGYPSGNTKLKPGSAELGKLDLYGSSHHSSSQSRQ